MSRTVPSTMIRLKMGLWMPTMGQSIYSGIIPAVIPTPGTTGGIPGLTAPPTVLRSTTTYFNLLSQPGNVLSISGGGPASCIIMYFPGTMTGSISPITGVVHHSRPVRVVMAPVVVTVTRSQTAIPARIKSAAPGTEWMQVVFRILNRCMSGTTAATGVI